MKNYENVEIKSFKNINNYKLIDTSENLKINSDDLKNKYKFVICKCCNKSCNSKSKCIYNFKYCYIIKKIILNLLTIIYNLLAFFLYYKSLEGCFEVQSKCIPLLSTMFLGRILIFGIISALMITIELHLIINKIIYAFHLIYIIIFYIIIYRYDHGTKLDYHGLYNFFLTILLIFIFFALFAIFRLVIYIKGTKNKTHKIIFFIIFSFLFIKLILFSISFNNSCKNWDKGLNSTILNNSPEEYNCKIIYPKKCLIYIFNDFFDFSFYLNKKCSINAKQEKEHNKFINYLKIEKELTSLSNLTHFGLPITVNNPFYIPDTKEYFDFHNFVYQNTILMDLYNANKAKYYNKTLPPEVEIFYDKQSKKRTAKLNLIKNETLSRLRNEISNNKNNTNISLFNNIMIIYLDCISRQHFLRKMKKTAKFIEKFMKYNNDLGFTAFQFMKYQTFAHWTEPNTIPMFFGSQNNKGRQINIIKYLKENGYITGNSGNLCSKESFELNYDDYNGFRLDLDEYDHENIAMFCDPNFSSDDTPYPIFSGPYGILRKCLYGLDTFQYLIEFGNQFWNKYIDNKKYLRLFFQDGHEPTGQVIKYLDESLYNYLNGLYENKLLNDTALFILSDHGNSYFNYIYYYIFRSDDSLIERGYGTLFIILPSNKLKKIGENCYNNLYRNQQALISPFDIHDTLIHIIFGNNTIYNGEIYSHKGDSLFSEFDIKIRSCSFWDDYFQVKEECLCSNELKTFSL